MDYETNKADQWHHAYSYDADNRITAVYTTSATPLVNDALAMSSLQNEPLLNPTWEKEAAYSYYAHGPLARTVIGEQEVQGLDYVYTLQGWIKGVNSNNLDANNDPGKDGLGLSANHRVAQDVMGYSLHYFNGDFLPIVNGNTTFIADQTNSDMLQNSSDLYNGNIARMVTTITDPNSRAVLPLGNAYQYDQLNRLKHAVSFDQLNGNAWAGGAPAKYENSFTYDANGNILTQTRNDDNNQVIDELAYFYPKNAANKTVRNRLLYVSDNVDYDASDIDPGMATSNYAYDEEGRLLQDLQEGIDEINWRVDGKVKSIKQSDNKQGEFSLSFDYDAMGHRIAKHSYDKDQAYNNGLGQLVKSTYYVLDAQGNTMAIYERAVDENTLQISYAQTEKFIYGSSRLGVQNCNIALLGSQNNSYTQTTVAHRIGKKGYELSNHLGNVLSVISDKVIPHSNGSTIDYWQADILQSTDYSPFGVQLSGRNLKLSGNNVPYVYGFNGMIKDDELKGEGNSYDFGARMLDSRLGRWLSIDKLAAKFAYSSTYCFSLNSPLILIDPDGNDIIDYLTTMNSNGQTGYKDQGSVLTESKVFNDWLLQFANNTSLTDDSKALGATASGSRSRINLKFQSTQLQSGVSGQCGILFKGIPLESVAPSELQNAKPDDFMLVVSLSDSRANTDESGVNAGDKLLTIIHETGLHAESQSLLLLDFYDGKITAEQLSQGYDALRDGDGEPDHLLISTEKGAIYESMVKDVKSINAKHNGGKGYIDLVVPDKNENRAVTLYDDYHNYSSRPNFLNKIVFMQDSFNKAYAEDKNTAYNPKYRSNRLISKLKALN